MNGKLLAIFAIAVLLNSMFGVFWKKSLALVSPPVVTVAIGIGAIIIGLIGSQFVKWEISPVEWNKLWPLVLTAIIVSGFYLYMGRVLTTEDISKIYPLLSIMTILVIAFFGWFFLDEPMTFKKITGIGLGMFSVWLILS